MNSPLIASNWASSLLAGVLIEITPSTIFTDCNATSLGTKGSVPALNASERQLPPPSRSMAS